MLKVAELPPDIEEILERHKGFSEADWAELERLVKSLAADRFRDAKLLELAKQLAAKQLTPG